MRITCNINTTFGSDIYSIYIKRYYTKAAESIVGIPMVLVLQILLALVYPKWEGVVWYTQPWSAKVATIAPDSAANGTYG